MSSSKSEIAKKAVDQNAMVAGQYYNTGLSAFNTRQAGIWNSLLTPQQLGASAFMGPLLGAGGTTMADLKGTSVVGEPAYVGQAFGTQRAGLTDANALQARAAQAMQLRGAATPLDPTQLGTKLAQSLTSSSLNQAGSQIEQTLNLYNMAAGSAGQAGNASLGAANNQLAAMNMAPGFNPTYAAVMGGLAGAGGIYGAYNQAQAYATANSLAAPGGSVGVGLGGPR